MYQINVKIGNKTTEIILLPVKRVKYIQGYYQLLTEAKRSRGWWIPMLNFHIQMSVFVLAIVY